MSRFYFHICLRLIFYICLSFISFTNQVKIFIKNVLLRSALQFFLSTIFLRLQFPILLLFHILVQNQVFLTTSISPGLLLSSLLTSSLFLSKVYLSSFSSLSSTLGLSMSLGLFLAFLTMVLIRIFPTLGPSLFSGLPLFLLSSSSLPRPSKLVALLHSHFA